jgi:hypothetical protein
MCVIATSKTGASKIAYIQIVASASFSHKSSCRAPPVFYEILEPPTKKWKSLTQEGAKHRVQGASSSDPDPRRTAGSVNC